MLSNSHMRIIHTSRYLDHLVLTIRVVIRLLRLLKIFILWNIIHFNGSVLGYNKIEYYKLNRI